MTNKGAYFPMTHLDIFLSRLHTAKFNKASTMGGARRRSLEEVHHPIHQEVNPHEESELRKGQDLFKAVAALIRDKIKRRAMTELPGISDLRHLYCVSKERAIHMSKMTLLIFLSLVCLGYHLPILFSQHIPV